MGSNGACVVVFDSRAVIRVCKTCEPLLGTMSIDDDAVQACMMSSVALFNRTSSKLLRAEKPWSIIDENPWFEVTKDGKQAYSGIHERFRTCEYYRSHDRCSTILASRLAVLRPLIPYPRAEVLRCVIMKNKSLNCNGLETLLQLSSHGDVAAHLRKFKPLCRIRGWQRGCQSATRRVR